MLNKIIVFFVSFFTINMIFGLYFGYLGLLIFPFTLALLIISIILSVLISLKFSPPEQKKTNNPIFLGIIVFFLIAMVYIIYPSFIFPRTCSDMTTIASHVRYISLKGTVLENSVLLLTNTFFTYPQTYIAPHSLFYSLLPNAYLLLTLISLLLKILTIILVYLIAKEIFNRKAALIGTFLYAFTIVTFFELFHGYTSLIFSHFFLLAGIYFYILDNKKLVFLSTIGLTSYLYIFALFFLFILLETFFTKNKKYIFLTLAPILVFPAEILRILVTYFSILKTTGRIIPPNLLALVPFIFGLFGIYYLWKKRYIVSNRITLNFFFAALIPMLLVVTIFSFNALITNNLQIYELYRAVKYFYTLIIPISIISGFGILAVLNRTRKTPIKIIAAIILLFHLFYFIGYIPVIKYPSFPAEYFPVMEKMHSIPGKFTLGIDPCFLKPETHNYIPFPYNPIIKDPVNRIKECRKEQMVKDFMFVWTKEFRFQRKEPVILDENGREFLFFNKTETVDYLLTDCSDLDKEIILQNGKVRLYKLVNQTPMT